ncbi:MULE domain-containing protein, partial [Aphis craccivora]
GSVGPVICVLAGEIWKSTGELNINEFSEDCDIFSVGQFVFDLNGGALGRSFFEFPNSFQKRREKPKKNIKEKREFLRKDFNTMEPVNEVRVILSERKKTLLVVKEFKYRLINKRKDNLLKWRCTKKMCLATILTKSNYTVLSTKGDHKHEKENKIELQVLREKCKQKASESKSTRPLKLIRTELLKCPADTEYKNIKAIREAMYIERRKSFPEFPKSIDHVFLQLKEMKNNSSFLNNLCLELCSSPLIVKKLHLDFETGAHEAAINIFPEVTLIGCRFHYFQCLWRKISGHSQLRLPYLKNDDFGKWINMFSGLIFLPPNEVEDAFVELISICPDQKNGTIFSDYVLQTFVSPDSKFPPDVWAGEPSLNPRTTNGPESFHRTFNGHFYACHPAVPVVISVLIQTQAETSTKMYSIVQKGSINKMAKKDKLLNNKTISLYNNYKNNKTPDELIVYLSEISQLYKPKKL